MKSLIWITLILTMCVSRIFSQGLQDGGQGSGGDEQAEYTIAVNAQWNLVSVPVVVSDFAKTAVFPTATTSAFAYAGGYVVKDTLDNGPGYWLKFAAPENVAMNGPIIYTDSIPVNTGWNMIGSISDQISSSSVVPVGTTMLTSFFAFNNGYQVASTIDPGLGYWVKVSTSGTLVLSSGSFPRPSMQDTLHQVLASLGTLTVTDAAGSEQVLYFGRAEERHVRAAELPPVPPTGVFDSRFASHSMIASSDQGILLSSVVYPVKLRWDVPTPGDFRLQIDGKETRLTTSGVQELSRLPAQLLLRVGNSSGLPREFALSQNYPNPFNPSTSIAYALPVPSRVRLELFSILGQRVATIVNDELPAGYHTAVWNGLGDNRQALGSGTYLLRMTATGENGRVFTETRKMMLLK